jgi:hypothetical protein
MKQVPAPPPSSCPRSDRAERSNVSANDGLWHHVAVTWSQPTGIVDLFLDGQLAQRSHINQRDRHIRLTLPIGPSILANGDLVIGQRWGCAVTSTEVTRLKELADRGVVRARLWGTSDLF